VPTTPNYQLRYPAPSAPANVPVDVQNLATDVDNELKAVTDPLAARISTLETQMAAVAQPHAGDYLVSGAHTPPAGYLLCDGSAVLRSQYAALFAAIGTDWGAGDGSTTFNLPDLQGRVMVGRAGAGGHADVATLGARDGTALANRRPKHRHTVNDPGHTHGGSYFRDQAGPGYTEYGQGNNLMTAIPVATTGITIGAPTDNLDSAPYGVVNVFVKT
jgi:microcystin-dependent protein